MAKSIIRKRNLEFKPHECYGVIGANGAGKSTFLKILTGEIESSTGEIIKDKYERISVLKQNHNAYDEYTVIDTVIMGNDRLYQIMKEKKHYIWNLISPMKMA